MNDDRLGPARDEESAPTLTEVPLVPIAAVLAAVKDLSRAEALKRLREDQVWRWLRGARVTAEQYLQPPSPLRKEDEEVIDLVWGEVLLRHERGEKPSTREYLSRFPQHADKLRAQFEGEGYLGIPGPE